MEAEVISPINISHTAPDLPSPLISRPHLINTIRQIFESSTEMVCVEGPLGYGKTILLREFADTVTEPCFSVYGLSLCFRSHQMLIGLLRSRHGFRTVPGDARELLDLRKLVSSAVRQAGGLVFGPD